jgi:hypothetical protein
MEGGKLVQFAFSAFALIALTPLFCFFMWKVFKRFVLQVVTTAEKKLNTNPFYRFIGFNEVTTKTEKVTFDGSENIPSGWLAAIGWVFIVGSSFIFFGLLWPKW